MSAVALTGTSPEHLIDAADKLLTAWRGYSDPTCGIYAETEGQPHNTITPILRKVDGKYRLLLVLRNNRTSAEHPLGIFHPHAQLHHIKKENIGLIEVMGVFILPGRLKKELAELSLYLQGKADLPAESPHTEWVRGIARRTGTQLAAAEADAALRQGVAETCYQVLCDAGVYKQDAQGQEGLDRFLHSVFG